MMAISVCDKICNECPFSSKSARGFLGGYTLEDLVLLFDREMLFPCHKQISNNETVSTVENAVRRGEYKLCRGYVECISKSAKLPRDTDLRNIVKSVKNDTSKHSMPVWEFKSHHSHYRSTDETSDIINTAVSSSE